jgi:hypothetical protein
MQSWTLRIVLFAFVLAACRDAQPAPAPSPDASSAGARCPGPPPIACEEAVDNVEDCSSVEAICTGVCGASYECCFCTAGGEWQILFTDCPSCLDAGVTDAL